MSLKTLRAVFMRGGTSKGLMVHAADLPHGREDWAPIFLAAMGSPDPNGRQLDGMGGGLSSLSKVCVIGPPTRPDADVDYTFAQVAVGDAAVDYAGNCGNMSSAVGPFAVSEKLVDAPLDGEARVRIHNVNTGKVIVSRFAVRDGQAVLDGDCEIDGVAGAGAPIRLDFVEPGGAKTGKLLPTGRPVDDLVLANGSTVRASLVDASNPCVFVAAADVGCTGTEMPGQLERDKAVLDRLEAIRQAASLAMGFTKEFDAAARLLSIPKVAMLSGPAPWRSLSGREFAASDCDIAVRMISVGQPHRAVPITGGLCVAAACRIPGTIASALLRSRGDSIRIAHPSGRLEVDAQAQEREGGVHIAVATVYRTARPLFRGEVLYRAG
jgi:2-methylaconitate cis-trans-isomerase PrpF